MSERLSNSKRYWRITRDHEYRVPDNSDSTATVRVEKQQYSDGNNGHTVAAFSHSNSGKGPNSDGSDDKTTQMYGSPLLKVYKEKMIIRVSKHHLYLRVKIPSLPSLMPRRRRVGWTRTTPC